MQQPLQNGVFQTSLDNGLRVVLQENHAAPVVAIWCFYKAGTRDERPGSVGISHWVEHLVCKDTRRFPGNTLDWQVARVGGDQNAFTWLDFTAYYITLPVEHASLALQGMADRMASALFLPEQVTAQRDVILAERRLAYDDPETRLKEAVRARAFRVHRYQNTPAGDLDDLCSLTRDDLLQYYRIYYAPNNATLVAAGDFQNDDMLRRVEDHFAAIACGSPPPAYDVVEPPQAKEQRVSLSGSGDSLWLQLAYRIPNARHPDFFPLLVLNTILCGASPMSLSGGTGTHYSCRLRRALMKHSCPANVKSELLPSIDPALYNVTLHIPARHSAHLDDVQTHLDAEMKRLCEHPVGDYELDIAIKQICAQFAYGLESLTNQGFWLGFTQLFADVTWYTDYVNRIRQVTIKDVQRVANCYLDPSNRIVGWLYR
jgi:zinc protease